MLRFAILAFTLTAGVLSPVSIRGAPAMDTPSASTPLDVTRLPLGDGRLAAAPMVGSVWPCRMTFGGGGAFRDGPWFNGDGTFDLTAKTAVDGAVSWPSAFAVTRAGEERRLTGNGLPNHPTGVFPIAPEDLAYAYDRNPNAVQIHLVVGSLPALPNTADRASCLPMGPIGVVLTGAALFNALDATGRDAVAHETQDRCAGHPERTGVYHYHSIPPCIEEEGDGHSLLVGYALDGFGIYGHHGEDGAVLTDADLDGCHGHTHPVEWDGATVALYHYHATWEYPYTVGCFRGTPAPLHDRPSEGLRPGWPPE